jgi:hypothetical protein
VWNHFADNCTKGEGIVATVASGLLADISEFNIQVQSVLRQKFSGDGLSLLISLIDINKASTADLRLIQGTNYGCPYFGFYD